MRNNELTVQPYIVVVGKEINNISSAYVCIDKIMYATSTVLQAFDLCFKSFFAFNAAYPFESKHIWTIIQKCYYNVNTNRDQIFPHTEHIIAKLRHTNLEKSTSNDSATENLSNDAYSRSSNSE